MPTCHLFWISLAQAILQKTYEQGVIAIPPMSFVYGEKEEMLTLQQLQNPLAVRALQHGIAQRSSALCQQRGSEQKALDLR